MSLRCPLINQRSSHSQNKFQIVVRRQIRTFSKCITKSSYWKTRSTFPMKASSTLLRPSDKASILSRSYQRDFFRLTKKCGKIMSALSKESYSSVQKTHLEPLTLSETKSSDSTARHKETADTKLNALIHRTKFSLRVFLECYLEIWICECPTRSK